MQKRRWSFSLAAALLFSATLACSFSLSSAKIENLRLAKDEAGSSPTTTFSQEDTFFLLGDLSNAPDDTTLKASWVAIEAQEVAPNTVIDEAVLETGSGAFTFSLENNLPLWPSGRYKVDLLMNDEVEQSLEFQVEQTAPAAIEDLRLANDEAGTLLAEPYHNEDPWRLAGVLVNAPSGSKIKTVWSAIEVTGDLAGGVIAEQEDQLENGPFSILFQNERTKWPTGSYTVDVYQGDQLVKTLDFQVGGGTSATVGNLQLASDEKGANPTSDFNPQDTFYLITEVLDAPAQGVPVRVVWTAVNAEGVERDTEIDTYEGTAANGSGWYNLESSSGSWAPGSYHVDFYLDDELEGALDFIVSADEAAQPAAETRLEGITLTSDEEGERFTNIFTPNDTFYLFAELVDAPQGASVEANWTAEDVPGFNPNEVISEPEVFTFDEGFFSISLDNEGTPWTEGSYRVEILLNGEIAEAEPFLVSDIKIIDPYTASDDTGSKRVSVYGTAQQFYLHFTLGNAPADTRVTTRWYRLADGEGEDELIHDEDFNFSTGDYYVRLNSTSGPWTPGEYAVDVYLNDYYSTTVKFSVQ